MPQKKEQNTQCLIPAVDMALMTDRVGMADLDDARRTWCALPSSESSTEQNPKLYDKINPRLSQATITKFTQRNVQHRPRRPVVESIQYAKTLHVDK